MEGPQSFSQVPLTPESLSPYRWCCSSLLSSSRTVWSIRTPRLCSSYWITNSCSSQLSMSMVFMISSQIIGTGLSLMKVEILPFFQEGKISMIMEAPRGPQQTARWESTWTGITRLTGSSTILLKSQRTLALNSSLDKALLVSQRLKPSGHSLIPKKMISGLSSISTRMETHSFGLSMEERTTILKRELQVSLPLWKI